MFGCVSWIHWLGSVMALVGVCHAALATAAVVGEHELWKWFGVSHPDQIVLFDGPAGAALPATTIVDGDGKEVSFQVLSDGGLAPQARTDMSPAAYVRTPQPLRYSGRAQSLAAEALSITAPVCGLLRTTVSVR